MSNQVRNDLPIIEVGWLDHMGEEETWITEEMAKKLILQNNISIGYLLNENENRLVIVQSLSEPVQYRPDEDWGRPVTGVLVIAKALITSRKIVRGVTVD